MILSLLATGAASMWVVRGLFIANNALQNTLQMGAQMVSDTLLVENPRHVVEVVPKPLVDEPATMNEDMFLMRRRNQSIGSMVVTRTGIFFIQGGSLRVFKSTPWGLVEKADGDKQTKLRAYQKQKAELYPEAYKLYMQAVAVTDTNIASKFTESQNMWEMELHHWLLHMILSDLRSLVRCQTQSVKNACEALIELMLQKDSSKEILVNWMEERAQVDTVRNALKGAGKTTTVYFFQEKAPSATNGSTQLGIQKWAFKTGSSLGERCEVFMEWTGGKGAGDRDAAPNFDDDHPQQWLRVGRIRYSIT